MFPLSVLFLCFFCFVTVIIPNHFQIVNAFSVFFLHFFVFSFPQLWYNNCGGTMFFSRFFSVFRPILFEGRPFWRTKKPPLLRWLSKKRRCRWILITSYFITVVVNFQVIPSEFTDKILDGPALFLHCFALSPLTELAHVLSVPVDGLRAEYVASIVTQGNHQTVFFGFLSVCSTKNVLMVTIQGIAVAISSA